MIKPKAKNNWPSQKELRKNRRRLERELKKKIAQYEVRYERKSENLESDFRAGKIKDTAEICDWAIIYETLKRISNAR